jgi:hypothetical protein
MQRPPTAQRAHPSLACAWVLVFPPGAGKASRVFCAVLSDGARWQVVLLRGVGVLMSPVYTVCPDAGADGGDPPPGCVCVRDIVRLLVWALCHAAV